MAHIFNTPPCLPKTGRTRHSCQRHRRPHRPRRRLDDNRVGSGKQLATVAARQVNREGSNDQQGRATSKLSFAAHTHVREDQSPCARSRHPGAIANSSVRQRRTVRHRVLSKVLPLILHVHEAHVISTLPTPNGPCVKVGDRHRAVQRGSSRGQGCCWERPRVANTSTCTAPPSSRPSPAPTDREQHASS